MGTSAFEIDDPDKLEPRTRWDVFTAAAAFYYACLKNGYSDEGQEFAEWFLETFDIDLEN